MANFNEIFTESSVILKKEALAILCFNDGKVLSKSKYSLENHTLSLLEDTSHTATVLYSNGIAETYEFSIMISSNEIQLPTLDVNGKTLHNLIQSQLLVFVDGILQPTENYIVDENGKLILLNQQIDEKKSHNIIIYANSLSYLRTVYVGTNQNPLSNQINLNEVFCNYNPNHSFIFIDGVKVDYDLIENINPDTHIIKLNIPTSLDDYTRFEIVNFLSADDTSKTLNFVTQQGYLTYGPVDDFGNTIPDNYDLVFIFSDQVKLLVDNIRPGFIIKELTGYGEAVVVDTTFETTKLKCLTINGFSENEYKSDEYYFKVPEYKNIINYLSEYDRKYQFLPEILNIFQRLLLDEIHDTIKRLRDMRSIQKVDSVNIDRLLFLLGCNLNIKTLTKKQRRELIEELNEFYRIVGTRDSYNLLNILQNDLKLINIEQLFTPFGEVPSTNKEKSYNYTCTVPTGGGGNNYTVSETLKAESNPNIQGHVVHTQDGSITTNGFELTNYTGNEEINSTYNLVSNKSCIFNVVSTPSLYRYNHTLTNRGRGYRPGQILKTSDRKFTVTVQSIYTDGRINQYSVSPTTGSTSLTETDETLYVAGDQYVGIKIYSSIDSTETIVDTTLNPATPGEQCILHLEPGIYEYEISGAGGGGAAYVRTGNYSVSPRSVTSGNPGYKKTGTFTITDLNGTNISYIVGAGGKGGYAINNLASCNSGTGGTGYSVGSNGSEPSYITNKRSYGILTTSYRYAYQYGSAGGGGGSSALFVPGSNIIASGGKGGNAILNKNHVMICVHEDGSIGGNGGASGGTEGNGADGGNYNTRVQDVTNTAIEAVGSDGSNGWIKIKKIIYKYNNQLEGNYQSIPDGTQYSLVGSQYQQTFNVNINTISGVKTAIVSTTPPLFSINETFSLDSNVSATLTITSSVQRYRYNYQIMDIEGEEYLSNIYQEVFEYNTPSSQHVTLTYKRGRENEWIYSPTEGSSELGINNATAKHTCMQLLDSGGQVQETYWDGTGARIQISSVENLTRLEDRCYIDFYTKQELGAELKEEYRIPMIDYGLITQGTPNSPIWWIVGEPDLNYGIIFNRGDYPEESYSLYEENYGLITTKIIGEWVQWWVWDRESIWYPTNHVAVELKMPTNIDFKEYTETFVEQFYKMASTVVFIHHIIESFLFGTESELGKDSTGIEDAATLGIATGAPVMDYEMVCSSNPLVQYEQKIPSQCTITINPIPSSATVKIKYGDTTRTFTGQASLAVNYGEKVTWEVSKSGYKTKSSTIAKTMLQNLEYGVTLERIMYNVTVNSNPNTATVTLSANGYNTATNTGIATIKVLPNTSVQYTVSKNGYTTVSGNITANDNLPFEGKTITLQSA